MRRAKQMVSAAGSSAVSTHSSSDAERPWASPWWRRRSRTWSTIRTFDAAWACQSASPSTWVTACQASCVGPLPVIADGARQHPVDLGRDPRRAVHAVGDGTDGRLLDRDAGPQVAEHVAADLAVQRGHPVAALGEPHAHHGHVERLVARLVGPVAERHELVDRDAARLGPAAEVPLDQLAGKRSMPAGTGRVGGEHRAGPHRLEGLGEREPVGLHQHADALQAEEAGVALVGVEHLHGHAERRRGLARRRCRAGSPGGGGARRHRRRAGR